MDLSRVMLSKERIFAILLAAAIVPVIVVPLERGWIANFSEFTSLVVSGLVVAMIGGAAALWWRGGKKPSGAEAARGHGANPGIFHRHDRHSELEEAKRRALADLEGECNRRSQSILLAGGPAADELIRMLGGLHSSWWRPNDSTRYEFDRANIIRAVELTHRLPNPLDPHEFTSKRLDLYRKEIHRRYGY
jgi:hypothetical protein